jgi:hypothetical protein
MYLNVPTVLRFLIVLTLRAHVVASSNGFETLSVLEMKYTALKLDNFLCIVCVFIVCEYVKSLGACSETFIASHVI